MKEFRRRLQSWRLGDSHAVFGWMVSQGTSPRRSLLSLRDRLYPSTYIFIRFGMRYQHTSQKQKFAIVVIEWGIFSATCKGKVRCLYCGEDQHDSNTKTCYRKDAAPICINCGGQHIAISMDCPMVMRHKMAAALASAENISMVEAKKRITREGALTRPPRDSRFDFTGFPLPGGGTDASEHGGSSQPRLPFARYDSARRNRFAILESSTDPLVDCTRTYARVAAGRRPSAPIRGTIDSSPHLGEPGTHSGCSEESFMGRGSVISDRGSTRSSSGMSEAHRAQLVYANCRPLTVSSGRDAGLKWPARDAGREASPSSDASSAPSPPPFLGDFLTFVSRELIPALLRGDMQSLIEKTGAYLMSYIHAHRSSGNISVLKQSCSNAEDIRSMMSPVSPLNGELENALYH